MPMFPMACPIPRHVAGPPVSLGRPCIIKVTPRPKRMNSSPASRYFARNFNSMSWSVMPPLLRATLKNSDQPQGRNSSETEQQGIESLLRNARHAPSTSPKTDPDGRNERGIQRQSARMDEPKRNTKWDLE